MVSESLVDLSRLQFAATAMYHFLFVPLTLGMTWMLVIMESIYVMTRRPIWRTITRDRPANLLLWRRRKKALNSP